MPKKINGVWEFADQEIDEMISKAEHAHDVEEICTLTADRDKWRDRCERLIGHYGNSDNWERGYLDTGEGFDASFYVVNANGYSFAQQIQKEIDDENNAVHQRQPSPNGDVKKAKKVCD